MKLDNEDYSDLVFYLAGMFSIKRMRDIQMDIFIIHYKGSTLISGPEHEDALFTEDFPEKGMQDHVRDISMNVECPSRSENFSVLIAWDHAEIGIESDTGIQFMDFLDRSTFRYF
jgi:aspartyl aminopeptidase